MLPAMCAMPACRNMLVSSGRNATSKGAWPESHAGMRAGMVALAVRNILKAVGGSVYW